MCAGVGQSGSPAPKPTTFSPCACRDFALASTARVAEGVMDAIRALIRLTGCHALTVAPPPSPQSGQFEADAIRIPAGLLPSDGRFGSGPSKVRSAQVEALAAA